MPESIKGKFAMNPVLTLCRAGAARLLAGFALLACLVSHAATADQGERSQLIALREQLEMQLDIFSRTPAQAGTSFSPEQTLERLQEIESELIGKKTPLCSRKLRQISDIAAMQGDYPTAIEGSELCLSMITWIYGADHWRTSESRKILRSIQAESKLLPAQRQRLLRLHNVVSHCSKSANAAEMRNNLETLTDVQHEMRQLLDRDHSLLGAVYAAEFSILMELGEFRLARDRSLEQIAIHEPSSVPGETLLQTARINLATTELELGHYDEAYRILVTAEAPYAHEEPSLGHEALWNTKAIVLIQSGAFLPAKEAIERYIQLREARFPWDTRSHAVGLGSKGAILLRGGDLNAAMPVLQQAIQLAVGADDPITEARARLSLAEVLQDMHRYKESEGEMRKSLELRIRRLSTGHPDTIRCIKSIAVLQLRQKRNQEAAELTSRALEMLTPFKDEQPTLYSEVCHLDGIIQQRLGNPELARKAFLQAEKFAPQYHGGGLFSRFNRLAMEVTLGEETAADELELVVIQLGNLLNPRESVLAFEALAAARLQRADVAAAVDAMDVSRRALRIHHQVNLPGLSQSEQLSVVNAQRPVGGYADYIHFAHQAQQPGPTAKTLEWVLNDKGFVTEVLADVNQFNRNLSSASDRALAEELQVIRGMFAKELAAGQTAEKSSLVKLQRRADEISLELGLAARPLILNRPWVTVNDLRKRLPGDSVLVEILRTSPSPSSADVAKYFAWVVPPDGIDDVQLIDLGPASRIDDLVTEFRQQMQAMQKSADISTVNSSLRAQLNADAKNVTTQLARLILGHQDASYHGKHTGLSNHLTNFRRWIISPDAMLWLFPWDTLPLTSEDKLVAHRHVVSYLTSGRQLTLPSTESQSANTLTLYDPSFGEGTHRPTFLAQLPRWGQLPGTADQVSASADYFRKLRGQHYQLSGHAATEEAFRRACKSLGELFIATHGYSALAENGSVEESDDRSSNSGFQPLQFCGLVMAGGNLPTTGQHDNYLSGEEIMQLDLEGSNVFCTACVSGLGLNQDGQGVASLNQAFQLAGARSLVTTLWEVQQQSGTVPLMNAYWAHRSEDKSPVDALAEAKLKVLSDSRTAHPYFWAGFTASMTPEFSGQPEVTDTAVTPRSAELLLKWARYTDALKSYDQLLIENSTPELLAGRGCALLGLNRLEEAHESLTSALELNPDHLLARYGMVRHAFLSNTFSDAIDQTAKIMQQYPLAAWSSLLGGQIAFLSAVIAEDGADKLKNMREAESMLSFAVSADPDLLEAQKLHGMACGFIADQLSIVTAQGTQQNATNPESRRWLQKAVEALDRIVERNDQFPDVYLFRAEVKIVLLGKDFPSTLLDCCEACRRNPDQAPFLQLLVQSLYFPEIQSQTGLIEQIEDALKHLPRNYIVEISALQTSMQQLIDSGRKELEPLVRQLQAKGDADAQRLDERLKRSVDAKNSGDQRLNRIKESINNRN